MPCTLNKCIACAFMKSLQLLNFLLFYSLENAICFNMQVHWKKKPTIKHYKSMFHYQNYDYAHRWRWMSRLEPPYTLYFLRGLWCICCVRSLRSLFLSLSVFSYGSFYYEHERVIDKTANTWQLASAFFHLFINYSSFVFARTHILFCLFSVFNVSMPFFATLWVWLFCIYMCVCVFANAFNITNSYVWFSSIKSWLLSTLTSL